MRHSLADSYTAELEKVKQEISLQKQSEVDAAVEQQVSRIREDMNKVNGLKK